MKKTSIGTWAYNVGPYGENPIPFDTVGSTLAKLNFQGMELGGFNGYPNPHNHPEKEQRDALKEKMDTRNLNFKFEDIQVEMKNGTAINVGNPHVVFFVDELQKFNIEKYLEFFNSFFKKLCLYPPISFG